MPGGAVARGGSVAGLLPGVIPWPAGPPLGVPGPHVLGRARHRLHEHLADDAAPLDVVERLDGPLQGEDAVHCGPDGVVGAELRELGELPAPRERDDVLDADPGAAPRAGGDAVEQRRHAARQRVHVVRLGDLGEHGAVGEAQDAHHDAARPDRLLALGGLSGAVQGGVARARLPAQHLDEVAVGAREGVVDGYVGAAAPDKLVLCAAGGRRDGFDLVDALGELDGYAPAVTSNRSIFPSEAPARSSI